MRSYLPEVSETSLAVIGKNSDDFSERELMYKFLFDMKGDLNELKKLVVEIINNNGNIELSKDQSDVISRMHTDVNDYSGRRALPKPSSTDQHFDYPTEDDEQFAKHEEVYESLSLEDREKELIQKH